MSQQDSETQESQPRPELLPKKRARNRVERVVSRILAKRQPSPGKAGLRRAGHEGSDTDYHWF